jgi:hypothetical protein
VNDPYARVQWFFILLIIVAAPALAEERERSPGYVDGSMFLDLATEDTTSVEINLSGAILKAIASADADLQQLAGGLESIHAVILEFTDEARVAKVQELLLQKEKELRNKNWEVLTRIKEGTGRVTVLVLNDGEAIQGLVVLVSDGGEVVFANIAGTIDLNAIAKLGESFDIPGLDDIVQGDD